MKILHITFLLVLLLIFSCTNQSIKKNSSFDDLSSNDVCGCAFLEALCEGEYRIVKNDVDSVKCSCDSILTRKNMDTCDFTQQDNEYIAAKIKIQMGKMLCKWHTEGFCGNASKMKLDDSISFLFYFDSTGFLFVMPDSMDNLAEYGLLDVRKTISRHRIATVYANDFHFHPENSYSEIGKLDLNAPCLKKYGVRLSAEALNNCSKMHHSFIPGQ